MNLIFDFFRTTFMSEFQTTMTGDRIAIGLLVSFFLSLFILFVYRVSYQGVVFSKSFAFSLLLLSMVTSVVIMTVTTNLALSLGMVGALSIVRFRTAVKDPVDTVPENKNAPQQKAVGSSISRMYLRSGQATSQSTVRPTEYRSHKGGHPLWAAGAETPSWTRPSSSGQLPVPVALNARSPTLFANNIHQICRFVNTQ